MDTFLAATAAPYVFNIDGKDVSVPKLTIRNIGKLAAKVKATQVEKLKALVKEEKDLNGEAKAKFMAVTVAKDYNIVDVWDWSTTIDGGFEILKTALVQGGMPESDADKFVDILPPEKLADMAMEACDHYNCPTKVAKRLLEEKAKEAEGKTEDPK
jgi:hypothetical protein